MRMTSGFINTFNKKQYEIIDGLGTQYVANQKLGQLEDILEKHNIESAEDLDNKLKRLKALEMIKSHLLNRDMDSSGIYLEFHHGFFEPYYTIEIKPGSNQIVTKKEYDIFKEALL